MVLNNTMHTTSSCKQWRCTTLCTPPATAGSGTVQYYALHQQLQAMGLYKTAFHQQLPAMVPYNTMHSTSSCKQWCRIILCTPPAAASNGAVQYYALHQQLQGMVLYSTMHSTSSCKQWCCTILCTPPAAARNGAV